MKVKSTFPEASFFRSLPAGVLVALIATISSGSTFAQTMPGMQHGDMKSMGSDGSMKMHMAMQEGQKKMDQMEMSGDTDHDFAMMMRDHHQTGIDMAKAEVANGKDSAMVSEAKKIIASQQKDIQKFDAWLRAHPKK